MSDEEYPTKRIAREDVESVSEKLRQLARDLPESEQAVLGLVLNRAQASPEDLDLRTAEAPEMPGFEQPFASQLARAAGLFAEGPEVTVVVGWQYSFPQ